MSLTVNWVDRERESKIAPDPRYPRGVDLDMSKGAANTCSAVLPYPAKRCGVYIVICEVCRQRFIITTAGRRDDPKSVKVACPSKVSSRKAFRHERA